MTTGEDNQEGRQLMFTDSSFGMLTENVEVPKLKNRELKFSLVIQILLLHTVVYILIYYIQQFSVISANCKYNYNN